MKRKVFSALFLVILCLGLAVPAFAAANNTWVMDEADLLTASEERKLSRELRAISQEHEAQIVVVTVKSAGQSDVDDYVEEVYDSNGFGYGKNRDGVLLLVEMDHRQYRILCNGFADDAIDYDRLDAIGDAVASKLSDGDYADAFSVFAQKCDYYLGGYLNGFPFRTGRNLLIAIAVGFAAGLVTVQIMKGKLKSVRMQSQADAYIKPGSMQVTVRNDLFLYRNVTRTKRENSKSSGSGGSSRKVGGGSF